MLCMNCSRETDPIQRFDGELFCRECLHPLFPVGQPKLVETVQNSADFAESERLFYEEYILNGSEDSLCEAVKLCRQSAYALNPYACLAMGYYCERKYIGTERSDQLNVNDHLSTKSALRWYSIAAKRPISFGTVAEFFAGLSFETTVPALRNIISLLLSCDPLVARSVISSCCREQNEQALSSGLRSLRGGFDHASSISSVSHDQVNAFVSRLEKGNIVWGMLEVSRAWVEMLQTVWSTKENARRLSLVFGKYDISIIMQGSYANTNPIGDISALAGPRVLGSEAETFLVIYCRTHDFRLQLARGQSAVEMLATQNDQLRQLGLYYDFTDDDLLLAPKERTLAKFVNYIKSIREDSK